jgi:hypothetical protein
MDCEIGMVGQELVIHQDQLNNTVALAANGGKLIKRL